MILVWNTGCPEYPAIEGRPLQLTSKMSDFIKEDDFDTVTWRAELEGNFDYVRYVFSDIPGTCRHKLIPTRNALKLVESSVYSGKLSGYTGFIDNIVLTDKLSHTYAMKNRQHATKQHSCLHWADAGPDLTYHQTMACLRECEDVRTCVA